ncbi:MAG TPA: histidine kinase [Blastocatellia bacterium]|nr:histidine kinase [Blastocatellia bacterium]
MSTDSKKTQRWLVGLFIIGYFTAHGLLIFAYKYLDDLARERPGHLLGTFVEEMTGAYSAAILFPFLLIFARRFPVNRDNWFQRLPVHLVAMTLFSLAHTTLIFITRNAIAYMAGYGSYDYGIMSIRYVMEFSNDVINYWLMVAFINLFDHYRRSRDRELNTAQLETRLAQAQLQSLRLQLQPHFLFNTLNTISAMVYQNPRAADEMIARLSDLLRLSLRNSEAQEVTLQEELDFLKLYLEIMRARFEERLVVNIEVEPGQEHALVPQLILQPLVENSIRHALDPASEALRIAVRAKREDKSLLLEVSDNGPGIRQGKLGNGIGLSNTQQRLHQLYGVEQAMTLTDAAGGGLLVNIRIPFHTSGNGHTTNGARSNGNDPRNDH